MDNEIILSPIKKITATDIANFLETDMYGQEIHITEVQSLDSITKNALVFSKSKLNAETLKNNGQVCFITTELPDCLGTNAFIIVENPRLAFAKTLSEFFVKEKSPGIGEYTTIHKTATIGKYVCIGNNCTISRNVVVGDNTEIRNNVVIAENAIIGHHCLIKSNSVIGEKGFGFEFEKDGTPLEIPHLKSVQISNYVEIGALNTIVAGVLNSTIIHSDVKTDDHVHIAHNCEIGSKTLITACCEISGSVRIGEKCWLGPNCSIMNKINIGDNSLIGLGAVVTKNVPPNAVMVGNPAKILKLRK